MTDLRDKAYKFEAVKIAMKQDKSGHIMTLSIHPNDVPEDLMRDWVGSRYMVAMVKLDDDGEPVTPPAISAGEKAVQQAGMLCRNPKFQMFVRDAGFSSDATEGACVEAIKTFLHIGSRGELRVNANARKKWNILVEEFEKHVRSSTGGRS